MPCPVFGVRLSGCSPNPGQGSIGIVIADAQDSYVHLYSENIGHWTSFQVDYHALVQGLELCRKYTAGKVIVFTKKDLIINHMTGSFRVESSQLISLYKEARRLEDKFGEVLYENSRDSSSLLKFLAIELRKLAIKGMAINAVSTNDSLEIYKNEEN